MSLAAATMSGTHVRHLLIGGGLASSAAVEAIRRVDRENSILLVGQEVNRPYHRPELSGQYLLGHKSRRDLFTLDDHWLSENGAELRSGVRATQLDLPRHAVLLSNGAEVFYDRLLIATGGSPRPLVVPGAALPNLFYLRTLEDADRLRNAVEKARREGRPHEHGRGRAAVIGGSLLGMELASTLTGLGLTVDVVFTTPHPWARFAGETTGRFLARYVETRGVHLHSMSSAIRLEGDGRVQRVILSSGECVQCDFVVGAIGMLPHRELVRGTAIAAEKAILVDQHCRTNRPDVYAAGDCAAIFDPLFGKYRVLDHWESAVAMGRIAGLNMAGVSERYDGVNSFSSAIFGLKMVAWGESRHVERRIVRGSANVESPDFVEIAVGADGRVSQVMAVNHAGEDEVLRDVVRRRLSVTDRESMLRDPAADLRQLLG